LDHAGKRDEYVPLWTLRIPRVWGAWWPPQSASQPASQPARAEGVGFSSHVVILFAMTTLLMARALGDEVKRG